MFNILRVAVIEIPETRLTGRFNSFKVEDKDNFLMAFPLIDGNKKLYPIKSNIKRVRSTDKIRSIRKLLEYCHDQGLVPYILPETNDARLGINIPYALWSGEYTEDEILNKIRTNYNLFVYDLDDSPEVFKNWLLIDKIVKDSYEILKLRYNVTPAGWRGLLVNDITSDKNIVYMLNVHTLSTSSFIFPNIGLVFFYKDESIHIHSLLCHGNIQNYNKDDEDFYCKWSSHYCSGYYYSVSLDVFRTTNIDSAYRPDCVAYSPGFSFIKWYLESK